MVYQRLLAEGSIAPIPAKPVPNPLPRSYDPTQTCAYHSGAPGHPTARCWNLKHKVEDMIRDGQILLKPLEPEAPNVTLNPLPQHDAGGPSVNMLGWDFYPTYNPSQYIYPTQGVSQHPVTGMAVDSTYPDANGYGYLRQTVTYGVMNPPSYRGCWHGKSWC